MTLRFHPLPPVPDVTAAAVRAAFPKGNLYVDLRAECGRSPMISSLLISIHPRGAQWRWAPGAWPSSW